jgi:hypothetical protein
MASLRALNLKMNQPRRAGGPGSVATGDMITMVEADDFIFGFEHQTPKRRRAA